MNTSQLSQCWCHSSSGSVKYYFVTIIYLSCIYIVYLLKYKTLHTFISFLLSFSYLLLLSIYPYFSQFSLCHQSIYCLGQSLYYHLFIYLSFTCLLIWANSSNTTVTLSLRCLLSIKMKTFKIYSLVFLLSDSFINDDVIIRIWQYYFFYFYINQKAAKSQRFSETSQTRAAAETIAATEFFYIRCFLCLFISLVRLSWVLPVDHENVKLFYSIFYAMICTQIHTCTHTHTHALTHTYIVVEINKQVNNY